MPGGVVAFRWYRLRAVVHGCQITASAAMLPDGPPVTLSYRDEHCLTAGRIGLRSHSAGGVWKNLAVLPLSPSDLLPPAPTKNVSGAAPANPRPPMPYAVDEPVTVARQAANTQASDTHSAKPAHAAVRARQRARQKALAAYARYKQGTGSLPCAVP